MNLLKKKNGFVLADAIIALVVFGIALLTLAEVLGTAKRENTTGRFMSVATGSGTTRIENLRERARIQGAFTTITSVDWKNLPTDPALRQKVEVSDNSPTLKTVTVRTALANSTHEVILKTMVAP